MNLIYGGSDINWAFPKCLEDLRIKMVSINKITSIAVKVLVSAKNNVEGS